MLNNTNKSKIAIVFASIRSLFKQKSNERTNERSERDIRGALEMENTEYDWGHNIIHSNIEDEIW